MGKITYTEQMKQQDKLFAVAEEDRKLMKKLFDDIVTEARKKGFGGEVKVYDNGSQVIADFGAGDVAGNCTILIKKLERKL